MLRAAILACLTALPVAAEPLRVVTDIAPVQSLVARVMPGGVLPGLLVPPGASEHDHALRPSEARMLAGAALVVVIGPALVPWIEEPLATLSRDAYVIQLSEVPGLPHAAGVAGDSEGAADPHIWLDPVAAQVWLPVIADALADLDPANAAIYRANAEAGVAELGALQAEVAARMAPLAGRGYLVFHDAYRHFEGRFGLASLGAILSSDAHRPGAAHFADLRAKVKASRAVCVFTEPQFSPRLAEQLVEGTDVRLGTLDPLGAGLAPGPTLYPQLIRDLAKGFESCLAP